jgi:hypothetical protein
MRSGGCQSKAELGTTEDVLEHCDTDSPARESGAILRMLSLTTIRPKPRMALPAKAKPWVQATTDNAHLCQRLGFCPIKGESAVAALPCVPAGECLARCGRLALISND